MICFVDWIKNGSKSTFRRRRDAYKQPSFFKKEFFMREYIKANLTVIRKYLKNRKKHTSKLNNASIMEEFKEWSRDPLPEKESIWTLPDLTRKERLKNFCRSINKEIR